MKSKLEQTEKEIIFFNKGKIKAYEEILGFFVVNRKRYDEWIRLREKYNIEPFWTPEIFRVKYLLDKKIKELERHKKE